MRSLNQQRRVFIIVALIVPVLLLAGFVMVPALDLIRMSFTDWDGYSPTSNFIALENYKEMLHNKDL